MQSIFTKVTHLQNVRQIFHEKTHYLRNEFVASYFFLEVFLGIWDLKKKQFLYDGVWTVVTIYPAWGLTHSDHAERHYDITCQQGLSEKWRPFLGKEQQSVKYFNIYVLQPGG